jgi:hypothetical protein
MFPQTFIILYVSIGKQLKTFFVQSTGGGAGQSGLADGLTQGVFVGVGVGDGEAQGSPLVLDGVGVGVGV